jgi:orotate phosphoribosyltransferase
MHDNLVKWLFETNALRICPENEPFWYTSGKIGPYYINTHFLYGSEQKANDLLTLIDSEKKNPGQLHEKLFASVMMNYNTDLIFRGVIDEMVNFLKTKIKIDDVKYISGGERRDWFFSLILAEILNKPHITIFKDLSMVMFRNNRAAEVKELECAKVLHVADLITEASSYERAWIPAIKSINGRLSQSLVVIDRRQGGAELLNKNNVQSLAMCSIDLKLFNTALSKGYINNGQFEMVKEYIADPTKAMRKFIILNPSFLKKSIEGDTKTAQRAKLCIDKGFYS